MSNLGRLVAIGCIGVWAAAAAGQPPRFETELRHPNPGAQFLEIHFSPDGKRVFTADYPGGVGQVWDVATGKPLTRIETGAGYCQMFPLFQFSRDWNSLFVPTKGAGKVRNAIIDGVPTRVYEYDGRVEQWDLKKRRRSRICRGGELSARGCRPTTRLWWSRQKSPAWSVTSATSD